MEGDLHPTLLLSLLIACSFAPVVAWHFMRARQMRACATLFPRSRIFSEKTMSHAKGNHFSTARILISTGDYFHCQVCNISFPHWSKQASNRHLQFLRKKPAVEHQYLRQKLRTYIGLEGKGTMMTLHVQHSTLALVQ